MASVFPRGFQGFVVGGTADQALRRAAGYGDGWIMGASAPNGFADLAQKLDEAWRAAGRDGQPRKMALNYFALGDDPRGDTERSVGYYYSIAPDYAAAVVMFPASADAGQVDELAAIAL